MPATASQPELQTRNLTCRKHDMRHSSVNEADRSFETVVSTEVMATVYDHRSYGHIDEVLVSGGGVFPESVVLLDNHQRHKGVESILGSATDFRREGNQWVGRGVIGKAAQGNVEREQKWLDLLGGHIKSVSIGYQVKSYIDIPAGRSQKVDGVTYQANERTLRISTSWRVHELSLTPIPADENANIRSKPGQVAQVRRRFFR